MSLSAKITDQKITRNLLKPTALNSGLNWQYIRRQAAKLEEQGKNWP